MNHTREKYMHHKTTDIQPLLDVLDHFNPVSPEIAAYLREHVTGMVVQKKRLLLKPGMVCRNLYFIQGGSIRGFIKEGKKEITTWITTENELVTSITGLYTQQPSREYIQAIEDSELLVMSLQDLDTLYAKFPEFNLTGRKLLQRYYMDAENRAFLTRLPNAGRRYNHFLQTQGQLASRIPLTLVASYLGITLETLSRIRRKLATSNGNPF